MPEEFNDIWNQAPKFPDVEKSVVRIDVDSFVQIYRDIDDLFEDDLDDNNEASSVDATSAATPMAAAASEESAVKQPAASVVSAAASPESVVDERDEEIMEAELESIFDALCDGNKLISKETVQAWDEVSKLLEDGLLDAEEFEELWRQTKKSPGSDEKLDLDGFLSFNVALDGLFAFDDDEMDDGDETESDLPASDTRTDTAPASLVEGEGIPTKELFRLLSSNGALTRDALLRWGELREFLDDGDLTESEVGSLFANAAKGATTLDLQGFTEFRTALDGLFEDDDEEEALVSDSKTIKQGLLELLDDFSDPDLLPCGLDFTGSEQEEVLKLVTELERQPSNLVRARGGDVSPLELNGSWELLYSSSSAMRFNKGLSGLGGSFPNGKFGGLKQVLKSSKFVSDVEYIERIEVNPSAASFDVVVTGDWDLRRSVSLFTGEPSLVMTVEPGRVTYGPTSTRADHWKSLGPLNMLDISYLDEDLRIMRGNTSIESIFIFRRTGS